MIDLHTRSLLPDCLHVAQLPPVFLPPSFPPVPQPPAGPNQNLCGADRIACARRLYRRTFAVRSIRQKMSDSKDTQTGAASVRIHQPSPLAAEIAAGPGDEPSPLVSHLSSSAEGMAQSSRHSIQAERDYAAAQRNEAREDADELHQFRMLALERQKATGGFAGAGAQAGPSHATGGAFEPFVGSRVGSPIPDKNGLGWPGASRSG